MLSNDLGTNLGLVVPTEKLRDENWKEEFDKLVPLLGVKH
jgi:hypothetical protein